LFLFVLFGLLLCCGIFLFLLVLDAKVVASRLDFENVVGNYVFEALDYLSGFNIMLFFYFPKCLVCCALLCTKVGVKLFTVVLEFFEKASVYLSAVKFKVVFVFSYLIKVSMRIILL